MPIHDKRNVQRIRAAEHPAQPKSRPRWSWAAPSASVTRADPRRPGIAAWRCLRDSGTGSTDSRAMCAAPPTLALPEHTLHPAPGVATIRRLRQLSPSSTAPCSYPGSSRQRIQNESARTPAQIGAADQPEFSRAVVMLCQFSPRRTLRQRIPPRPQPRGCGPDPRRETASPPQPLPRFLLHRGWLCCPPSRLEMPRQPNSRGRLSCKTES